MLTRTSEYAVLAMIYLAQHTDDWPIAGRKIAEATGIPRKYLAAVLGDLVRSPGEVSIEEIRDDSHQDQTECEGNPISFQRPDQRDGQQPSNQAQTIADRDDPFTCQFG